MGLAGLRAALELILELGVDAIASELLRKRAWLIPALRAKGCEVLEADAPAGNASSIVSFEKPGEDSAALHERLEKAGIIGSIRTDRSGRKYIRLSPHFYNTDEELERVLEFL